ncbi:MAG: DUF1553 domain-containing protein [Acidobacteria bacterium]|nr:DUF1553 domain-containing protein [Acidobacteriota bacterium]
MGFRRTAAATLLALLPAALLSAPKAEYKEFERKYWAFARPERPAVPDVGAGWAKTPVDRFILAALHKEGLEPAPEADRATLIRRAYFDMLGLPPTPAEVADFVADRSPDAWETVVDRLLASPHYGERWGQHWLDVVRYAETEGFEYDRYLPGLWRYRDYVISSFNDDKPFVEFLREQLAGDEMVEGAPTEEGNQELLIAAGFHRLGAVRRNAGNQEVASSRNEVLTDRTDIVGAAFLGLTVGCARCHDHKFDPIRQKDYYRMQAFLAAGHEADVPLGGAMSPEEWRETTKKLRAKLKKMRGEMNEVDADKRRELEEEYSKLEAELPPPPNNITTIHDDFEQVSEVHVLNRGNYDQKGEQVGMRMLGVLLPEGTEQMAPDTRNPRLILANWLANPEHPLTARVFVNRIWTFHFGKGIVNTPNDFGFMGDRPSHPELLDWLATEYMANGWRMKPLHKMILMSATYRQASESPAMQEAGMAKDADNRLLWHGPMRRLSAEEVRDAMLSVSGRLNSKMGGESVIVPVQETLVDLLYDPTQWAVTADAAEHDRRSVYLIAKRNLRLPFMEVFDQPASLTTCARRDTSTHAPQSLELLNGTLSNDLAKSFADRLEREVGDDPRQQVERAYLLAANRMPTAKELETAQAFLAAHPLREFALAMMNLNAFLYVQ